MKYDIIYWSKRATQATSMAKIAGQQRRRRETLEYLAEADRCIDEMMKLLNPEPWYKKFLKYFRKNK